MSEREQYLKAMGDKVVESFDPELMRAFDVADNEVSFELKHAEKLRFKEGYLKLSGDGIFYTLQGEGPTMGEPTVFLRLHICNLRCVWCDAWYTWNPKSEEFWQEPLDLTIKETAEKVKNEWGAEKEGAQKRLVITGGEPMLQLKSVEDLIDEMGEDWKIEIETNGTIMPTQKLLERAQFNCSPKLVNSANSRKASIRPEVLRKLAEGNTSFKFVVMEDGDLDEIEKDFIQGVGIPHSKVILMPQGVTPDEVRTNGQRVAEYAKQKGYRLLGRLQVDLWGAKRGV